MICEADNVDSHVLNLLATSQNVLLHAQLHETKAITSFQNVSSFLDPPPLQQLTINLSWTVTGYNQQSSFNSFIQSTTMNRQGSLHHSPHYVCDLGGTVKINGYHPIPIARFFSQIRFAVLTDPRRPQYVIWKCQTDNNPQSLEDLHSAKNPLFSHLGQSLQKVQFDMEMFEKVDAYVISPTLSEAIGHTMNPKHYYPISVIFNHVLTRVRALVKEENPEQQDADLNTSFSLDSLIRLPSSFKTITPLSSITVSSFISLINRQTTAHARISFGMAFDLRKSSSTDPNRPTVLRGTKVITGFGSLPEWAKSAEWLKVKAEIQPPAHKTDLLLELGTESEIPIVQESVPLSQLPIVPFDVPNADNHPPTKRPQVTSHQSSRIPTIDTPLTGHTQINDEASAKKNEAALMAVLANHLHSHSDSAPARSETKWHLVLSKASELDYPEWTTMLARAEHGIDESIEELEQLREEIVRLEALEKMIIHRTVHPTAETADLPHTTVASTSQAFFPPLPPLNKNSLPLSGFGALTSFISNTPAGQSPPVEPASRSPLTPPPSWDASVGHLCQTLSTAPFFTRLDQSLSRARGRVDDEIDAHNVNFGNIAPKKLGPLPDLPRSSPQALPRLSSFQSPAHYRQYSGIEGPVFPDMAAYSRGRPLSINQIPPPLIPITRRPVPLGRPETATAAPKPDINTSTTLAHPPHPPNPNQPSNSQFVVKLKKLPDPLPDNTNGKQTPNTPTLTSPPVATSPTTKPPQKLKFGIYDEHGTLTGFRLKRGGRPPT